MTLARAALVLVAVAMIPAASADMTISGTNFAIGEEVQLSLAIESPEPGSSVTAVLFMGDVNATEPSEWYILHWGPNETLAMAGHDPNQTVAATWSGSYNVTFERLGDDKYACNFLAVTASVWDGDRKVIAASPAGAEDLSTAWDLRGDCHQKLESQPLLGEEESPLGFLLPLLAVALVALAARRR